MRTFREAMIVSNNLKAMKNLLEFIEANGGDPGKFVDWFTSEENLMEAGPASNPLNLPGTSHGAGNVGSYIGAVGGGLGGLITGAGRGISNVAGSFASGIAQGAKAGYRAVTADLPSSAKNATDALKNLEKRISQSAELKAMFKDPNFIPLLQNLQKTIATALVENRKSRSVINEAQKKSEYKKVFIELAKAGIDPHEALQIYVENQLYLNEFIGKYISNIVNWFRTSYKDKLKNLSNKQDQDAIANAMTALGKLQQDIPAFGQKPSQEFEKFAQELAIAVNNATGGAHGAEAYKEITSDLKNKLKSQLALADQPKIDQVDQNAFVNVIVKKFNEFKQRFNGDAQQNAWVKFVAQEIVKNPANLQNIESMINGYHTEKFFLDDMLKNKLAARDVVQVKSKLAAITDQNMKFRLVSNLMQHAAKYAGIVKNDPTKMQQWYTAIKDQILSDPTKARIKAEELERQAGGGPATTKAKAYMDAVTGAAPSKYDNIRDDEKDAFERQFQATYMAVGDNPDSGKQILQKTIELFSPQLKKRGSVNLFAKAYEQALNEKIREWYDGVSGNNFASELQPVLKTATEQLKLVQKFNQALKAGTGKDEFWQDIGIKLRNNENILESRKPKVDQQFLDSILGKSKNPQAGWFNY